ADVNQNLHAVIQGNTAGVFGILHHHAHRACRRSYHRVVRGLNSKTVTDDAFGKYIIRNLLQMDYLSAEESLQLSAFRRRTAIFLLYRLLLCLLIPALFLCCPVCFLLGKALLLLSILLLIRKFSASHR